MTMVQLDGPSMRRASWPDAGAILATRCMDSFGNLKRFKHNGGWVASCKPSPRENFSTEVIAGESCPHKSSFFQDFSGGPWLSDLPYC